MGRLRTVVAAVALLLPGACSGDSGEAVSTTSPPAAPPPTTTGSDTSTTGVVTSTSSSAATSSSATASTTSASGPPRAMVTLVAGVGEDAEVDPDGTTPSDDEAIERRLTDLAVGDCVDFSGADDQGPTEIESARLRPCDEPHGAEVYARISLHDDPEVPHPGDEAVLVAADEVCLDAFDGYVGVPYVQTDLEIVHLRPTAASWVRGDRSVICAVVSGDGGPLERSVRAP